MSSAITFASSCTEPGASAITMSNTFKTLISIVMKTTLRTGASRGTVIRRNTCHSVAPSVLAASSVSRGIAASPAAITTIENPAQIQMYANMIDGVISFSPSQEMPRKGFANVSAPIATWYCPASSSGNSKVPFSAVDALSTLSPLELSSSTVTPGMPSSSWLDLTGSAAARAEVSPDDAVDPALQRLGPDGLDRVLGHLGRADPRQTQRHNTRPSGRRPSAPGRRRMWHDLFGRRLCIGEHAGLWT